MKKTHETASERACPPLPQKIELPQAVPVSAYSSLDTRKQELLEKRVQPWVERLPWQDEHPVAFDASEGYLGEGVIGCRAGPWDSIDFENLAHEMGHAIEALSRKGEAALAEPSWGMVIKTHQEVLGKVYYEPVTTQATRRECRAVGIQIRLLEAVGHPSAKGAVERHAKILVDYMPDALFIARKVPDRRKKTECWIESAYRCWPLPRVAETWAQACPVLMRLREPKATPPVRVGEFR